MARISNPHLYAQALGEVVDRALQAPVIGSPVPRRFHPEVDDYTMSCGMARTPGGRIWLAWFAGGDDARAVIVMASSDDDGQTFSEPRFILDAGYAPGGIHLSTVVGNLWTAPDGRLFFFFTLSLGFFDGRAGSWCAICENPDAEKPVWNPPSRIWHGASLNKPTVLADGTWLFTSVLWKRGVIRFGANGLIDSKETDGNLFHDLDPERKSHVFASKDQGRTWERRGAVVPRPEERSFDEPMIVERRDGSLLLYMRTSSGMSESVSADGGYTWTEPAATPFTSASARFFFTKLASGKLLLVRYADPEVPLRRSHLTAYISNDEGASWVGGLLLDERTGISYPDGFQCEDGRLFIQYDYRRESGEILMAVFTEADAEAGRDVSGKAILKRSAIRTWTAKTGSRTTS